MRVCRFLSLLVLLSVAAGCGTDGPQLVLHTSPGDAEVIVDGFVHPGPSPHTIAFKVAGRFQLEVVKDGFQPVQMWITLNNGQRLEQSIELIRATSQIATGPLTPDDPNPPVEPIPPASPPEPVAQFTLNLSTSPAGATAYLRRPGTPNRRLMGTTPTAATLPVDQTFEVILELAGYKEDRRLVTAPGTGNAVNLNVVLNPQKKNAVRSQPLEPAPPNWRDLPPVLPNDSTSFGFLSIHTTPWTAVHLDGKSIGNSPVVRIRVKTGEHVVLMENRDLGLRRKKRVQVRAGDHVRLVETLR